MRHAQLGFVILAIASLAVTAGAHDDPGGSSRREGRATAARARAARARRDDDNVVGLEAGFRYQATSRLIWDFGVGTDVAGPRDRAPFFFTTGISFGFRGVETERVFLIADLAGINMIARRASTL